MDRRFLTTKELLVLAGMALTLVIWLLWPKGEGAAAVVRRGGEELGRYRLSAPARVDVAGANAFSLCVVVEDGAVHVEDSTCPDLICQRHAPISKSGQAIVCLPGQVTITVEGGERRGPDTYAG